MTIIHMVLQPWLELTDFEYDADEAEVIVTAKWTRPKSSDPQFAGQAGVAREIFNVLVSLDAEPLPERIQVPGSSRAFVLRGVKATWNGSASTVSALYSTHD